GDRYGHHTHTLLHDFEDGSKKVCRDVLEYKGCKLTLINSTNKITNDHNTTIRFSCNPSAYYYSNNYYNCSLEDYTKYILELAEICNIGISEIFLSAPFEPSFTIWNPSNIAFTPEMLRSRIIAFISKEITPKTNSV